MSEYAFETYGDLKAAIARWLMRKDLTGDIPQFVRLCEAHLDRKLRVKEMVQRRTAEATDQYITLPADWRAAKNVQRLPSREPMHFATLDEIDKYRADMLANRICTPRDGPDRYALLGGAMELAPMPTSDAPATIELVYYANVPRLTEDEDSSWLLRLYPDVYLYGTLVHSAPFLKNDERLSVWDALFKQAVADANESDEKARFSGAPLRRTITSFGV